MTYMEYIRKMSDEDFAFFLNFLQPDIELFAFAMDQTLKGKGTRDKWKKGDHGTVRLHGDDRDMYFLLQKDFDKTLKDIENRINENFPHRQAPF